MNELNVAKNNQCDNYCIMIASKYFESIDDFINLELGCSRFLGNMTKFYFNPISLTKNQIHFFPYLQTLHCYKEEDELIQSEQIQRYVVWWRINYYKARTLSKDKEIEFKQMIYTKNDRDIDFKKGKRIDKKSRFYSITIPEGVKELEENCFYYCQRLGNIEIPKSLSSFGKDCFCRCKIPQIYIPETIKEISKNCFKGCDDLSQVTIDLNETRILCGKKLFSIVNKTLQMMDLPSEIKIINGKEIEPFQSLQLPTTITSISKDCFENFTSLVSLELPFSFTSFDHNLFSDCIHLSSLSLESTIKSISFNAFKQFRELEQLSLSTDWVFEGDRLFSVDNKTLSSILLPSSLHFLNEREIQIVSLSSYSIPSNCVALNDYCFANCDKLSEIKGLENIKEFGNGCFYNSPYYQQKEMIKKQIGLTQTQINQLEEWTSKQIGDTVIS